MYCYQSNAWTPLIGHFSTYEEAAKAFKDEFYYSSASNPQNKELTKIAIENGVNPKDTEAVKNLFASFAIKETTGNSLNATLILIYK